MKKKSITYTDLSKKQLQHLKELYIQKKVECMSHKELKEFVLEIISHQIKILCKFKGSIFLAFSRHSSIPVKSARVMVRPS